MIKRIGFFAYGVIAYRVYAYGDRYRGYRRHVRMLIPVPRRHSSRTQPDRAAIR